MNSKSEVGSKNDLDTRCVNTIRTLAMDAIQKANSGHPGAPMGLAAVGYVLWTRVLKHNPQNPDWLDRDRFVLSGGHASMLLYSLLHLTGYNLSLDDLKNFRQWESRTPGHPEYGVTPGVETTTGPLGQGVANAVGMAMAERHLAARFNQPDKEIVGHYTYVVCGDGDMMEGISSEAASLAGHLGLGRLICIYDDNGISIEGSTAIAFTEDVGLKFEAFDWQVLKVEDGNDLGAIEKALNDARAKTDRPTLIMVKTHIAYGSPNKQDTASAHGEPLGEKEICLTKECLGCDPQKTFCVDDDVLAEFRKCVEKGKAAEEKWKNAFQAYRAAFPDLAKQWLNAVSGFIPDDFDKDIPPCVPGDKPVATRAASGKTLNAIAARLPTLMGGSADLAPSNKTYLDKEKEFQKGAYQGRNIRFGVREHAMAAIMSGLFLHNGIRPFGGTFLVFADYMRPAIRVASLMKLPLIYVFTHDSVAVGEDGPTHQPVEQLCALRAIPGLTVIRPADAAETAHAWRLAVSNNRGPVALILSRQNLPVVSSFLPGSLNPVASGAYIIDDSDGKTPDLILIASGSEVHIALAAAKELRRKSIRTRVVSMPSWELFEAQPQTYRDTVLPPRVRQRLAVEAGIPMGWERYVGGEGRVIGMTRFGASAPGDLVLEKFGFHADNIVQTALDMLGKA